MKGLSNQCHRALGILQYLIVGDPQNPDTERVDELGSFSILFDLLIVNWPIHLDCQPTRGAIEVDDLRPNRVLAAKLEASIPLDPQHLPERVLSFRRFATILAR